MKGFTADLGTHNATPFLHRYLYRDYTPHCILSCFATSVLYANRTPANTAMVMRALHSSVRELVDAEAGRVLATPVEKLARAQALFLYQIVRLFDGDVALRAQGEKDIPLLQAWLGELCKVRDNLGDLAQLEDTTARKQPPKEWEVRTSSLPHGIDTCLLARLLTEMDIRRICAQDHCHGILGHRSVRTDEGPGAKR